MIYLNFTIGAFIWFAFIYAAIPTLIHFIFKNNQIYDSTVKKINNQIKFELKYSIYSILIFSIGASLLAFFYNENKIDISFVNINYSIIFTQCIVLIIWNDLHFYFMHYLMHKTSLKKFHALHHRLRYPSVYSSYALHPVEAMLLGSVMPMILLFVNFHIISLLFLTIWSLVINSLEHNNKQYGLQSLTNHQLHHSHYHGNYSFFFSFLDKIFKTEIKK